MLDDTQLKIELLRSHGDLQEKDNTKRGVYKLHAHSRTLQPSERHSVSLKHSPPVSLAKQHNKSVILHSQESGREFTINDLEKKSEYVDHSHTVGNLINNTKNTVETCVQQLETSLKELENSAVIYLNSSLRGPIMQNRSIQVSEEVENKPTTSLAGISIHQ